MVHDSRNSLKGACSQLGRTIHASRHASEDGHPQPEQDCTSQSTDARPSIFQHPSQRAIPLQHARLQQQPHAGACALHYPGLWLTRVSRVHVPNPKTCTHPGADVHHSINAGHKCTHALARQERQKQGFSVPGSMPSWPQAGERIACIAWCSVWQVHASGQESTQCGCGPHPQRPAASDFACASETHRDHELMVQEASHSCRVTQQSASCPRSIIALQPHALAPQRKTLAAQGARQGSKKKPLIKP
jgi:hypothetical protein